jgi:hypothetical protein
MINENNLHSQRLCGKWRCFALSSFKINKGSTSLKREISLNTKAGHYPMPGFGRK